MSYIKRLTGWLALVALMGTTAWGQTTCDLTTADAICVDVNGAYLYQGPSPASAGTGNLDPFYRLPAGGSGPTIEGYNTGGGPVLDVKDREEALLLSVVTQVTIDSQVYREFFLDVNQVKGTSPYILDRLEIWVDHDGNRTCYDPGAGLTTGTWTCGGADTPLLKWAANDDWIIHLNYDLEAGSGVADMTLLVPDEYFGITDGSCDFGMPGCDTYIYLYSRFQGDNAGFEEWATSVQPFVTVTKTIVGTANAETTWEITKTVDPDEWHLFTGDSGTSEYKVKVTPTTVAGDAAISGTINVCVPPTLPDGDLKSESATVTDVYDFFEGVEADVNCPAAFPFTINPGNCVPCTYTLDLDSPIAGTNTATAVVEDAGTTFSGTALIAADDYDTVTAGDDEVNVTDTNGDSWGPVTVETEWTYTKTFTCDADEGTNDNTAEITETGEEASASVEVNCYDLVVTKDASTSKKSMWEWEIEKTAYHNGTEVTEAILVPKGSSITIDYEVVVSVKAGFPVESDWSVEGDITVSNPAPMAAEITGVADVISPAIAATVDCGAVVFPYTLAAGGDLECSYGPTDLADGTTRTNTATATLQNYDYDEDLVATASGTTDFSGNASVDFSAAVVDGVDECVDVDDTYEGDLGEVCYGDAPKTLDYDRIIEAGEVDCTEFDVENTASFETNDTGATGSDDALVTIEVPCDGCTYTQGYWKTHNGTFTGGASKKADDTWCEALDPDCQDTDFFGSGKSYFDVLWTPPAGGNAWFSLAHQYIAAWLNCNNADEDLKVDCGLYSAGDKTIEEWLEWAEDVFTKCPYGSWETTQDCPDAKMMREVAGALDDFNNGIIGPGHCGDEEPFDEEGDGEKAAQAAKDKKVGPGANSSESDETESTYTPATVGTPAVTPDSEGRAVSEVPNAFGIANFPNPFNPQTTISIAVPELSHVSVAIFDLMGRFVAQLVDGSMPAGTHTITWSAEQLPSGTYFLMMRAGEFAQTRQMTLLK